jgi:hypothetical protein
LNDFHESNELLEACAEFPYLSVPGLRDRLERVLSGTGALKQETPETGAPRNFLFELVMASTLKRAGYYVHLDRIEDVYFEISGIPCFMECKRVHSQRKLGERIGLAADQIRMRCDSSQDSRARGIVAVDISKLLNPGTHLFDVATREALSLEAERMLESYRVLHRRTLEAVHETRVLGVRLRAFAGRAPSARWPLDGAKGHIHCFAPAQREVWRPKELCMTSLRRRMTEDMQVRNLSSHIQATYVQQVSVFARHFNQSPEVLGPEEIRSYQVYLTNEKKLSPGSILIAVAALRFLYKVTLRKDWS